MTSTKPLPPRWIRLSDEGIITLKGMLTRDASRGQLTKNQAWDWLTTEIWDYRESCARHSCWQTWRSLLTKFFLWCAEKSCGSNN